VDLQEHRKGRGEWGDAPTLFVNGLKSESVRMPALQQMVNKELAKRGAK
jgi:hypothetical protein